MHNCSFLSTSMPYAALAYSFRLGISTVHYVIREVFEGTWKILAPFHMSIPTREMLLVTSHEFYSNCVGSIDRKHTRLKCPSKSGTKYPNYKHYYSVVLQGFADGQYRFTASDGGAYGQQSSGRIFLRSSLYQLLNSNNFNMIRKYHHHM